MDASLMANVATMRSQNPFQSHGGKVFRGRGGSPVGRGGGRTPGGRGGNASPMMCQIYNRSGHSAINCFKRLDTINYALTNYNAIANLASADNTIGDGSWYPDSRATHHITNDMANLNISTPYNGSDTLAMGNGAGLPITHVGVTNLHTESGILPLRNVLLVPSICKNLLSISRFCCNNRASMKFLPTSFIAKDLVTK